MPGPCAVEPHARGYKKTSGGFAMPRPYAVEPHARSYKKTSGGFAMPRRKAVASKRVEWLSL